MNIFNGNCVPEVSIITTQVDESSLLNRPMYFIVCVGTGIFGNSITEPTFMLTLNVLLE